MLYFAHTSAVIDDGAQIGENTKIWHFCHICANARIGSGCNLGQSVFVGNGAIIGNHCKLQNNVNVYTGVTLEDFVFCGPSMTFTNDKTPRCKYPKDASRYYLTRVCEGASIGAQAVIVCGVTIGKHASIGAGAVVTRNVPDYALMVGNPARQIGWVCECGAKLSRHVDHFCCGDCGRIYLMDDSGTHLVPNP